MLTLPGFLVNSMDPGAGASLRGSIATAWSALTEANTIRGCVWCVYVDCGMFDVVWKATRMTKPALFRVCGRIWPWLHCGDQPGNWPWVKIFISLMLLNETKKRTQIIWTQIPKASRVLQSYSGTLAKKTGKCGNFEQNVPYIVFPSKRPKNDLILEALQYMAEAG